MSIEHGRDIGRYSGSLSRSRLVNECEAAEILGLKVATLRRWRWAGSPLPFIKLAGRAIRYSAADLEAFIEAGRRTSTSDAGSEVA